MASDIRIWGEAQRKIATQIHPRDTAIYILFPGAKEINDRSDLDPRNAWGAR